MDFPLIDYLDDQACYDQLIAWIHPNGLVCPGCGGRRYGVHRRHRAPVLDYQCADCHRVFNAFSGTTLQHTQLRSAEIVLLLRGIAQGQSTAQLARELGRDRKHLLELRHKLQQRALAAAEGPRPPLPDVEAEADEMYQNAGEKRHPARRSRGPAAAAGQQGGGAWHLGQGPATGRGCGRTDLGPLVAAGAASLLGRGAFGAGRAGNPPRHDGVYR